MIIDQLTYINLDSNTQRFEFINSQLVGIPTHIKVFKTPGIIISAENIIRYKTNNKKLKEKESFRGTTGCYLSHKAAIFSLILNIKESNHFSMIIEDDIYIDNNFWHHIDSIDNISDNIDIIFFDNTTLPMPQKYLHEIPKRHAKYNGAFCYAIKNSSLNKVFQIINNRPRINHIDHVMYNNPYIITYSYISNMIKHNNNFQSDRLSIN